MDKLNISSEELLDELAERVKKGEIEAKILYLYDKDTMICSLENAMNKITIYHKNWDIKKSARYRQSYEDYCLPLIRESEERKYNKEVEILKTKIKW